MIERLLHHIWLGPREVPQEWADAWVAMNPGWTSRVWREADLRRLRMRNREQFEDRLAKGIWHGAADIARYEVLFRRGGVYVDIDSRPLRSLDGAPFLAADVFAALEPTQAPPPGRVANGTIGAAKGSEAMATIIDLISGMRVLDPPWDTTGGTILTAGLLAHRRCCDVRILPARVFYPQGARGKPTPGSEQPYCEHFWSTTNSSYPSRVVVLVPRRAGDPIRDRIWTWCRSIWEQQGWPVFEGHHDEGLFNASIARNRAAAAAGEWEVAIFTDADTLPWDWRPLKDAILTAVKTGKFVRPFSAYNFLDREASERFMADGLLPVRGVRRLREPAHGGIHVVTRKLFERVGGYDERFVGWGGEDTAFEAACTALAGIVTLPGQVYHLDHPHQPRDQSTPQYQSNLALRRRYETAGKGMARLIAERSGEELPAEPSALLIFTNGRREWLPRTIASIEKHVGPLGTRLIVDDSGDGSYVAWLRSTFGPRGYRVRPHRHMGHGPAVHTALLEAAALTERWVFVCEDDMEFTEHVDLTAMMRVMDSHPQITQMVVRRQAWFPSEVAAGGMIERFPAADFTERKEGSDTWIEHRRFYSLNPHLVRTSFLRDHPWPPRPNSEHHFSLRLFRDPALRAGLWGAKDDPPRVIHIGTDRTGDGY